MFSFLSDQFHCLGKFLPEFELGRTHIRAKPALDTQVDAPLFGFGDQVAVEIPVQQVRHDPGGTDLFAEIT